MLNKEEILNYLSENKTYLRKKYFVDRIGLTGSFLGEILMTKVT
jgi:hypothetical protein